MKILHIAGRFWVYGQGLDIDEGRSYKIFDDIDEAVKFRAQIQSRIQVVT